MLAEFVQKILDQAPPTKFDIDGKTFSSKNLFEIQAAADPLIPKVEVRTLTGLVDLITNGLDGFDKHKYAIHVESFQKVSLVSLHADDRGRRQLLVEATPVKFETFAFGQWHSQEDFAIALQARFCDTPDREYVLETASSLTDEVVSISEDNGFSQKATAKAGLKQKESITLKPSVQLAPFRTFPEVPQPISTFVFRARTGPMLALFEGDGGKWKYDAMQAVATYLKGALSDLPIIC